MDSIEKGNDNVFADLDFENAEGMLAKAHLARQIAVIINDRNWTRDQAAEYLGISQSKLSELLRGRFRDISEAEMHDCIAKLTRQR